MKMYELVLLRTNPSIAVGIAVGIIICVIIPLFVFLYKHFKSKTLFFKEILDLKQHLSNVEREIASYKEIKDTGNMTNKEEQEWIKLARKHKEINQMIISLSNKRENINIKWVENPTDEYLAKKIKELKNKKTGYSNKKSEIFQTEFSEKVANKTKNLLNKIFR